MSVCCYLKVCFCFQGKRDESTDVDKDKAKEDAKVQQDLFHRENVFICSVTISLYVDYILSYFLVFCSDPVRCRGEEVGHRRIEIY